MVQKALGPYNSSKWGNMLWAFPACLWILTLGTGRKVRRNLGNTPLTEDFSFRKHIHLITRPAQPCPSWYTRHSCDCIQFGLECLCGTLPHCSFTFPPKAGNSLPRGQGAGEATPPYCHDFARIGRHQRTHRCCHCCWS